MNELPSFNRPAFLISAIMVTVMIVLSGGMGLYIISDPALDNSYMLLSAARAIDENYPDKINWEELSEVGREAMFERLDRYSSFYPTQQFDRLDEELGGSYSGVGITIVTHSEGLLIMSVRENGPADDAGLLSGDIIREVDSVLLVEMSGADAIKGLRGEEDQPVLVKVYRPVSDELFEVAIIRKQIPLLHIPFAGLTDDSVLYVRLLDFDPGAAKDLEGTLDSLVIKQKKKPRGIILDLRENPGGLFSEAYDVANLFLDEGIFIVGTEGKSRWGNKTFYSTKEDVTSGLPLAVLVNGGSASASEIVAGALQKSHRAILVGDTTFGKGLVQGFVRFPEGDGLKLTMSRYYLEGRQFLNEFDSLLIDTGTGLLPDFYFEFSQPTFFKRELENSMLLRSFAVEYEDDLIDQFQTGGLDDNWITVFIQYCAANDFIYKSDRTFMVLDLFVLAEEEKPSDEILNLLNKMLKQSQVVDKKQFEMESGYIKQRLIEIAYERRFGEYKSYKEVLLKVKPEIKYTTELLLGKQL